MRPAIIVEASVTDAYITLTSPMIGR